MSKRKYNRIKAVMVDKEMSSKDLGKHLSRGATTISNWCNNHSQPSIEILNEIADLLDVEVSELLVSNKK